MTDEIQKTILIVEDQAILAFDLEAALEDAGYEVVGIAATTAEALRIAATRDIDLATMDVQLAHGDSGVDTAIALQAFGIPSLFISGSLDDATRRSAHEAKPLGYLNKPIDIHALLTTIRAYFAR